MVGHLLSLTGAKKINNGSFNKQQRKISFKFESDQARKFINFRKH